MIFLTLWKYDVDFDVRYGTLIVQKTHVTAIFKCCKTSMVSYDFNCY